jgi:hypothetical protein
MSAAENYEAAIEHATGIKLFINTLNRHLNEAAKASKKYRETVDKLAGLMVPPLDAGFTGFTTSVKRSLAEIAKEQTQFAELCLATCTKLTKQHLKLKRSKSALKIDLGKRKGMLAGAQRSYKDIEEVKKASNTNSELSEDVWETAASAYEQCIGNIAREERRNVGKYRAKVLEITKELEESSRHFDASAKLPSALNSNCAPPPQSSLQSSDRHSERPSDQHSARTSDRHSERHSEQAIEQFTERYAKQISSKVSSRMASLSKSHSKSRNGPTLREAPLKAVKLGTDESES